MYWQVEDKNTECSEGSPSEFFLLNRSPTALASGILVFSALCTKNKAKVRANCLLILSQKYDILYIQRKRRYILCTQLMQTLVAFPLLITL